MKNVLQFLIKLNSDATRLVADTRRVTAQLDAVQAKATSVGASLKRAFSPSALGASLMSIPGMQFLMNPYTLIGAGIGAVAKLGSEAEMTATAFTTLVGSEEKAKSVLGEIASYAKESPFGKLDLTRNAQQMLSFGISADKSMEYLRQLGDIAGGDKNKLSSLSLVMGQVVSGGKLMGQDLMQFVNVGFNPLLELSKLTGKSMAEMKDLMSKGAISAEHVAIAIKSATSEGGAFYEMSEKQSKTIAGRFSSLVDDIEEMALSVFTAIRPLISDFLTFASEAIPKVGNAIMGVINAIKVVIDFFQRWKDELGLVATVVGVLTIAFYAKSVALSLYSGAVGFTTLAVTKLVAIQRLLNITMLANPIAWKIALIAALVAGIIYCWQKFAGFRAFIITMWDTMKKFGNIIKEFLIDRITSLLKGIGQLGKALVQLFKGDFSGAWESAKEGALNITGANAVGKAVAKSKEVIGGVKGVYQNNLAKESAKDSSKKKSANGISTPSLKGSASPLDVPDFTPQSGGGKGKKGKGAKDADAIATGGSRPTTINVSIGKFFDDFKVTMMDKADTHEIERVVLQALNRSLSIATNIE